MLLPSLIHQSAAMDSAAKGPAASGVLSAGPALVISLALSVLAITVREPAALVALSVADGALALCFKIDRRLLRQAIRLLLWQTVTIGLLYGLRFGPADGIWPALRTSWQLFLAFVPGMIVMHGTRQSDLERVLARLLPSRTAFIWSLCLKFVPMLLAEIRTIYESQVLRGARILPHDLAWPRNWPDVIHCLVVPAVIRGLSLAEDLARTATARDFGCHPNRTNWPGS